MDRAVLVDVLRQTALFAGFSETELEVVPKVGRSRHHEPGEKIVEAGGPQPRTMWVVIEGEVAVEAEGTCFAVLGPGEYFGELALLAPGLSRSSDVVARVPTETFELQKSHLLGLCSSSPEIAIGVMAELARRLHRTTGALRELLSTSADAQQAAARLGVAFDDAAHETLEVIDRAELPD